MASIDRRERERLETRTRIMDAARDLFAREGYEAVSMRRVAEAIEYSPTAIYVHFRDKQDLMLQICQCDFMGLAIGVGELQKIADPVERIRRMGHAYIRFGVEHPNHYKLMFMTRVEFPPDAAEKDSNHGKIDRDSYALLPAGDRAGPHPARVPRRRPGRPDLLVGRPRRRVAAHRQERQPLDRLE